MLRLFPPRTQAKTESASTADERAQRVMGMATRVFGDGSRAAAWLAKPNRFLDGESPLEVACASTDGYTKVCGALDKIAAHASS